MTFNPNREELAWAAGFFDGEGCSMLQTATYKDYEYPCLRVSVTQSGDSALPILVRFQSAVGGIGKILGPIQRKSYKPRWDWKAQGLEDCQAAIAMLWPFLSEVKRKQFKSKLDTFLYYHQNHVHRNTKRVKG